MGTGCVRDFTIFSMFSRGTRLYWSRWPKLGVCHAIFKLRSLFSNRESHDCCDSTMAASSHLGGFVMPFKGRAGSDGQNRVCVTLVSRDATFGQWIQWMLGIECSWRVKCALSAMISVERQSSALYAMSLKGIY